MKPDKSGKPVNLMQTIKPKDLMRLFGFKYRTAVRRYHSYRDSLGKNPVQHLFLHEVYTIEGIAL